MGGLTETEAVFAATEMLRRRRETSAADAYELVKDLRAFSTPQTIELAAKLARAFCVIQGGKK